MRTKLDIPAPVLEENKDEYLQEISEIAEAENWIKKHSIKGQSIEDVEPNIKPKSQVLEVSREDSSSRKNLLVVLSIMSFLGMYIVFIPAEETMAFFAFCGYNSLLIFLGYIWRQKNNQEQNQTIIIQEKDNPWNKPLIMFSAGFSIPFLFWTFQFSTLGEPCSVFCSGRELWNIYEAFFVNLYICGLYFVCVLFSRSLPAWMFGLGLFIGSFLGMGVGQWLA